MPLTKIKTGGIADDAITLAKMADGSVGTAELVADAVTAVKIDDDGTGFTLGSIVVDTSTLVVDATNNRVGINIAAPTEALHVVGNIIGATITGDLTGDVTGNADTVTNATLTTALTVNTGTLTLTGNSANTSVLTVGAGAVSVEGSNTGDQTLPTAGTLSGTELKSTVVTSSLTSVGTITSGIWNAGAVTSSGALTLEGANNTDSSFHLKNTANTDNYWQIYPNYNSDDLYIKGNGSTVLTLGTDQSATFAGGVTIQGANSYIKSDSAKVLWFQEADGTNQAELKSESTQTWFTTRGSIPMKFGTNDTLALTLGTDQSATFAGTGTFVGKVETTGSTGFKILYASDTSKTTSVAYDGLYTAGAQHQYIQSAQDIKFYPSGVLRATMVGGTFTYVGDITAVDATFTGAVLGGTGGASAPAFSFAGDTNTGMYNDGSNDNLQFSTGGVHRAFLSATQWNVTGNGIFSGSVTIGTGNSDWFTGGNLNIDSGLLTADSASHEVHIHNGTASTTLAQLHIGCHAIQSKYSDDLYFYQANGISTGALMYAGGYYTFSARRFKKNIKSISEGLSIVNGLNPVTYKMKKEYGDTSSVGFIADEIVDSIPDIVKIDRETNEVESLDYTGIIPYLTKAV